jgi:hypothetical protein
MSRTAMNACRASAVSYPDIDCIRPFTYAIQLRGPSIIGAAVPRASVHQGISLGTSDLSGSNSEGEFASSLLLPKKSLGNKLPFCDWR